MELQEKPRKKVEFFKKSDNTNFSFVKFSDKCPYYF